MSHSNCLTPEVVVHGVGYHNEAFLTHGLGRHKALRDQLEILWAPPDALGSLLPGGWASKEGEQRAVRRAGGEASRCLGSSLAYALGFSPLPSIHQFPCP